MNSATARRGRTAHAGRRSPRRAPARARRRLLLLVTTLLAAMALLIAFGPLGDAIREVTLPLRHDDIIRQQASDKDLDPALIAAVIYQESKFRDQTSKAGARGLMQITPDTARYIARLSGGTEFEQGDLGTPQINISYGAFYLRYLMDHYDGNDELAVAAYNAGQTNVDGWVRRAGGAESFDHLKDIPFPETRGYVKGVFDRREQYREHYADELGL